MTTKKKQYNYLIISTDEERYPPPYETAAIAKFRVDQMPGRQAIINRGLKFTNHRAASTACAPSRASIYTGHYPTLHGVSQTDGIAKTAVENDMFWLDPNTVPTMGDYFRAAGYETWYKGKWHVAHSDIDVPGTRNSIATNDINGEPIAAGIALYQEANRLDGYGFNGWVGPEPHGTLQSNTGYVRDPSFAADVVDRLKAIEKRWVAGDKQPWLLVSSFLNPHDIVLSGVAWKGFGFPTSDDTVPNIPQPPTQNEDLSEKPSCQQDYATRYKNIVLPQPQTPEYRKFYYYLHKYVDQQIKLVYDFIAQSPMFDDTIVVLTADHGEMLGAHGGMHQKWYNAYEESIHVPLVFSHSTLFKDAKQTDILSSHVDLLPTLLGISGIDAQAMRAKVAVNHSDARPLVGRDLSELILSQGTATLTDEPTYFMTNDEVSEGENQVNFANTSYDAVVTPNYIEAILVKLDNVLWKYARYFEPDNSDGTAPPDQFELYNLTNDPYEQTNLVFVGNETAQSKAVLPTLMELLEQQRTAKALTPEAGRQSQ